MRPEIKLFLIMAAIIIAVTVGELILEHYERRATRNRRIQFRDRFRDTYNVGTPEQRAMRRDWK